MGSELSLGLLELFVGDNELNLLDVVAVEEHFDAAEQAFAVIDLDKSAGPLGSEGGGGRGQKND
jgi:hypothetical protein